jgi:lysozyme
MRFQWLGGLLILYVLFQFLKKKGKEGNKIIPSVGFRDGSKLDVNEIFNLIFKEESFNPTAVKDGKDRNGNQLYTIGIGHQIQPDEVDLLEKTITLDEAKIIFEKDIKKIIEDMRNNIKVSVNKNQFLALLSLRYNIGGPQFNSSTLLKVLNTGDFISASEKFKEWRLSEGKIIPGLVARRERERVLFLKPV